MRSRIVSAAATNQSRSVAIDASLPTPSASLASTALLISSMSSSAGAMAARVERSRSAVWFAVAGADLRAKLGRSMRMPPMPRYLSLANHVLTGFPDASQNQFACTDDVVRPGLWQEVSAGTRNLAPRSAQGALQLVGIEPHPVTQSNRTSSRE